MLLRQHRHGEAEGGPVGVADEVGRRAAEGAILHRRLVRLGLHHVGRDLGGPGGAKHKGDLLALGRVEADHRRSDLLAALPGDIHLVWHGVDRHDQRQPDGLTGRHREGHALGADLGRAPAAVCLLKAELQAGVLVLHALETFALDELEIHCPLPSIDLLSAGFVW